MSSAWSITRAVNPPRAVYLDFPLGHTAGKPNDKALQRHIMIDTLSAFESIQQPGTIRSLPYVWSDTDAATLDWKQWAFRTRPRTDDGSAQDGEVEVRDARTPRHTEPQYQTEADHDAARAALAADGCPTCVFLAAPARI
ncbi:MAG: hypothetical protein QF921_05685 [Pseudomonadales bacterium]|jgi:hypothetical protein|nr:hypothetical protein [Pseudomonadales bacterium]MDP6471367.1 hypothetical protein [Pseudomonadales bacterium]MDP6970994.1 hypothetical protein [Pseudomonadales bacterium]|tara:strand:- start:2886 stop:3305 length:420 start_codon:yes stop_codon:yes gene_type:complete